MHTVSSSGASPDARMRLHQAMGCAVLWTEATGRVCRLVKHRSPLPLLHTVLASSAHVVVVAAEVLVGVTPLP